MQLPSLKVSIPIIFVAWCVAGVLLRGPVMLAYPAMWAGVAALFGLLHVLLKQEEEEAPGKVTVATESATESDGQRTDNSVTAAV
ncbi:MAG: hypothetical protein RH917_02300 [Lacipirellulaceae bacterium]